MILKSLPRKQVWKNKLWEKFFVRKFLLLNNHFLEKRVVVKMFEKIILVETFLWTDIDFLENRFGSKTFWEQLFEKFFWSKIFYRCKIISTKLSLEEKRFKKNFLIENFLRLQNNFLENSFAGKNIFVKHFWEKFFGRQFFIYFLENRFGNKF